MKLKNTVLSDPTQSRGAEMRERGGGGKPVNTSADRETHGNGEKASADKWVGCVVKRPTMRSRNGVPEKGERCERLRLRQTDSMTVTKSKVESHSTPCACHLGGYSSLRTLLSLEDGGHRLVKFLHYTQALLRPLPPRPDPP